MPVTAVRFQTVKNITVNHHDKVFIRITFLLDISTTILRKFLTGEIWKDNAGEVA
jgi:hypothetical protein